MITAVLASIGGLERELVSECQLGAAELNRLGQLVEGDLREKTTRE